MNHEYVSNNAFTNRIVQWHLEKALAVYDWLYRTYPTELPNWRETATNLKAAIALCVNNLWIPYDQSTGLIEQYEDFLTWKI